MKKNYQEIIEQRLEALTADNKNESDWNKAWMESVLIKIKKNKRLYSDQINRIEALSEIDIDNPPEEVVELQKLLNEPKLANYAGLMMSFKWTLLTGKILTLKQNKFLEVIREKYQNIINGVKMWEFDDNCNETLEKISKFFDTQPKSRMSYYMRTAEFEADVIGKWREKGTLTEGQYKALFKKYKKRLSHLENEEWNEGEMVSIKSGRYIVFNSEVSGPSNKDNARLYNTYWVQKPAPGIIVERPHAFLGEAYVKVFVDGTSCYVKCLDLRKLKSLNRIK